MVGLMQIMIYLFCIYLIYKGVEIFQIAYTSYQNSYRKTGIVIGIIAIIFAVLIAAGAFVMTESMVESMQKSTSGFPNLR